VSENPATTRSMWHRFTLGSGPLKRSTDRIQVLARILLVLAVVMAVPVALAVATATGSHLRTVADAVAASRHQVSATLAEDAMDPPGSAAEHAVLTARVEATWSGATGLMHGIVRAPVGMKAGSTVRVWVDDSGALVPAPADDSQIVGQAVLASLATFAGISGVAGLVYLTTCRLLERGRMRRWGHDWSVVEPVWSGKVP
jgi:hypothetical protein